MLDNTDILAKLKNILNERFGIDTTTVDDTTKLSDIGIDSLHVVDIMLDIETELDFNFQDLSLPPDPSIGEISASISKNLESFRR